MYIVFLLSPIIPAELVVNIICSVAIVYARVAKTLWCVVYTRPLSFVHVYDKLLD